MRILIICVLLTGCESISEQPAEVPLSAALSGARVKPTAVTTTGIGSLTATLSSLSGDALLDYDVSFSGLADNSVSAHLHGPADTATTGSILVDLGAIPAGSAGTIQLGATSGTATGTLNLKTPMSASVSGDSLHRLLVAGLVYIDVHTGVNTGGEIRGQIRRR